MIKQTNKFINKALKMEHGYCCLEKRYTHRDAFSQTQRSRTWKVVANRIQIKRIREKSFVFRFNSRHFFVGQFELEIIISWKGAIPGAQAHAPTDCFCSQIVTLIGNHDATLKRVHK